jgi:hypothetical protein
MDQFGRAKTDAYQSANNAAVEQGNNLEQQLFGEHATQGQFANSANSQAFQQLLAQAGFANTAQGQDFSQQMQTAGLDNSARQQALAEMLQSRMAPIAEVNALQSGAQPDMPQFGSGQGNITPAGAPNMGALANDAYQGQLNAYNAQVGQSNSTMGTVGSIAAAALMAF